MHSLNLPFYGRGSPKFQALALFVGWSQHLYFTGEVFVRTGEVGLELLVLLFVVVRLHVAEFIRIRFARWSLE